MKLPQNDAFALKRAMMQMPTLDNVPTSALTKAIISKSDPQALLYLIQCFDDEMSKQISSTDPNAVPEITGRLVPASDLDKMPRTKWFFRGEIPQKGLVVLFGASGGGKSFLALDYALRIAQKSPVVYIAAEGKDGYPNRVAAWKKHNRKEAGDAHFFFESLSMTIASELDSFIADIAPVAPVFIVVDTVAQTMVGSDENSARDMGLYVRACQRLQKEFDCVVMLVHHTNKGGADERGSGALRGAADTMLRFNPEDDLLVLESSKSKDYRPFEARYFRQLEIPLGDDDEGYPMSSLVLVAAEKVESTGENPTNNQIKVLTLLNDPINADGLGFSELIEFSSIPKPTLGRVLSTLFKFGFIEKGGRGKPYTITESGKNKVS